MALSTEQKMPDPASRALISRNNKYKSIEIVVELNNDDSQPSYQQYMRNSLDRDKQASNRANYRSK